MISLVLTITSLFLVIFTYAWSQRKPKNFPPGPWGIPILGHLPLLGLEPYKTVANWKSKYGPVVGIDFASYPTVFISDYKLAKLAFSNPAFTSRPSLQFSMDRSSGSNGNVEGLVFTSGRTWREQSTFVNKQFRQLKYMESIILEQIQCLIDEIRINAMATKPISTQGLFNVSFFNTLWALIAGSPFEASDPIIKRFTTECIDSIATVDVYSMLSMFIPWFGIYFPTFMTRADRMDCIFKNAAELIQPYIDQHLQNHSPGQQSSDFIDSYLNEISKTTDSESSFHSSRGKQSLMATLLDLFVAGIETEGTTLRWICLILATHSNVQDKIAMEIKNTIGIKKPSLKDRNNMPYTEAVLNEVMRFRTLVPMGAFHNTNQNVNLGSYDIPKDTMIYINIWEAHNNKEIWGDPQNFRPERWLNADGTEFIRRDGFFAFGTGKRSCIGEQLARDELFLFTVSLLQEFRIDTDPNDQVPSLEPKLGGTTLGPKEHKILFSKRK